MTTATDAARVEPTKKKINPGRNLPAAISVGLGLLAVVSVTMLFFPTVFMVLVGLFVTVGSWEVNRALSRRELDIPLVPMGLSAMCLPLTAYFAGAEALQVVMLLTIGFLVAWTVFENPAKPALSALGGIFLVLWVPFFLSSAALLFREEQGHLILLMMILLVVANDTFGYILGVIFGKHPMAPKISPKKSWEGFIGSVVGASAVGALFMVFVFESSWWAGVIFGVAIAVTATAGDFSQSMVKRELQIKDFSRLLPGHGGVMDRLDSIAFAAPATYGVYVVLNASIGFNF